MYIVIYALYKNGSLLLLLFAKTALTRCPRSEYVSTSPEIQEFSGILGVFKDIKKN